jgi:spore coat polysaccharide biosynthesis protein SpsF (cytidylyltransferase family)
MKIGILISIREKSTRLPGKVLKVIGNQTVTEHLIDRLKRVKGYERLIIATSDDLRDKIFEKTSKKKNIDIYFGDKEDKLLRYLQVSNHFSLDAVIVVDGDDILCFPEIIEDTIKELKNNNYDAIFWDMLPVGAACSGLTKNALEKVIEIKDESDTEVWGGYFTNKHFKVLRLKSDVEIFNHPNIRLTLDYQEDYDFFIEIFKYFNNKNDFSSEELMQLLVKIKPEINEINKKVQFLYEENLKKIVKVKFKE